MTNRERFNSFLQSELERLLAMDNFELAEAMRPQMLDNTASELFKIFLNRCYDVFVISRADLVTWLGSEEKMMIAKSSEEQEGNHDTNE